MSGPDSARLLEQVLQGVDGPINPVHHILAQRFQLLDTRVRTLKLAPQVVPLALELGQPALQAAHSAFQPPTGRSPSRRCLIYRRFQELPMAVKIAISGFGRIGRNVARAIAEAKRTDLQIVAVNDLVSAKDNAHLFKYDSVHGTFPGEVK